MIEIFGLDLSVNFIVYLMLSFAFFVGILLMVSQEAFVQFNNSLEREYGMKRRIIPKMEDTCFDFIDKVLIRYRVLAGLIISVCSFALLLAYK